MSDQRDTLGSSRQSRSLSAARQMSAHTSMSAACRTYRTKAGHVPMPVHNPLCGRCLKSIRTYLLHSAVYHTIDDLFLADHIEDDDRDQRKQIRCKRQVVVRTELRLECQLCQRQCIRSFP